MQDERHTQSGQPCDARLTNEESASAESIESTTTRWWVYLLACQDGRTYAGVAIDVQARFKVHLAGKGSKFTRANKPVSILGAQSFATKSAALKAEHALKQLERPDKLTWAKQHSLAVKPMHHAA
jgi:putative endonuclease